MGQDANGQCTLKGATMLAHQGGTCYYCVPMKPPADIYIPVDQGPNANSQGYTCGNSPVDPGCMMACFKQFKSTGEYVPPGVQPITGGTGTPAPGGVPLTATTSSDPCHPNYNLSTPAGQAAMQANARGTRRRAMRPVLASRTRSFYAGRSVGGAGRARH